MYYVFTDGDKMAQKAPGLGFLQNALKPNLILICNKRKKVPAP